MKRITVLPAMTVFVSAFCHAADLGMLVWDELPPLPDQLGVAGPFAGVSHDAFLVAGGANFPKPVWETTKVWRDTVYVLEKREGGTAGVWSVAGKLPRPLAYGLSVSHNGAVVCMGGEDGKTVSDAVFELTWDADAKTLRTETLPPLPQPCAFGQATLLGDTVYVAGGQCGLGLETVLRNFWRLDLSKRGTALFRWQVLPPWPGPERMLASVAAQNAGPNKGVYVIGGRRCVAGKIEFFKDGYVFDPASDGYTWRRIPDAPVCVAAGPCAALGEDLLFVFGGDDGALFSRADELRDAHPGFPKRAFAYDAATETWADAGPSPVNQAVTVAVPWGDRIVIPSGEIRPRVRTARVSSVTLGR